MRSALLSNYCAQFWVTIELYKEIFHQKCTSRYIHIIEKSNVSLIIHFRCVAPPAFSVPYWYCFGSIDNHSPSWIRWVQKKMCMPKLTEEIIYCREKFASTWQILHFLFTLRKTSFESICLHLRLKLHNAISNTHLCIFLCSCHLRHWAYIWFK